MAEETTLRIGLVGRGAIGRHAAGQIRQIPGAALVGLLVARPDRETPEAMPAPVTSLSDLLPGIDLLVDCAGHGALRAHAATALAAGIDVLSVSPGAMADADLERTLRDAAVSGAARLSFISGAIGGLDALAAAREGASNVCATPAASRRPDGGVRRPSPCSISAP